MRRLLFACSLALWSVLAGAFLLPAQAAQAEEAGSVFAHCQGEAFKIDLLEALEALPDDTPDAQLDQIRDWVWMTTVARIADKSHQPELLASLARQPLFRDESLAHLLDQPVGRTRSAVGKDGTIYILVQRSAPQQVIEDVLEAVDQEAFYLGKTPKTVQVYGVDLKMESAEAEVCKLAAVDQAWLRAPEQGFRQVRVTSTSDLAAFLAGGTDLLAASCHADKRGKPYLEVSGRHRSREGAAPVTVAHVAAVSRKTDGEQGLGFSLDPTTDLPEVLRSLDQLILALPSASQLASVLESWKGAPKNIWIVAQGFTSGASLGKTREALVELRDEIRDLSPAAAQGLLTEKRQSKGEPIFASLADAVLHRASHQKARYDGPVQGTEAAMTMFYTDLLAKLWAFDWQETTPSSEVPGFVSMTDFKDSNAHCDDDEGVPNTRIWFGSRQEGFLRERSGLRLAPNTTRIFALGSENDLNKEEEPSSSALRFIRWWDRHYTELAKWEPQYEVLNQLVKWTLVRHMAELSGHSDCLAFLDGVDTGPQEHFKDWITTHPGLRWRGPIPLLTDGPTETLPLLESKPFNQCGETFFLEGGVSLPPHSEMAERPITAVAVENRDPELYRVSPEKTPRRVAPGEFKVDIPLAKGKVSSLKVRIRPDFVESSGLLDSDIRLRDHDGFWEQQKFDYSQRLAISQEGDFKAKESLGSFGIDHLDMTHIRGTAGKVTVRPGSRRIILRLAEEMSDKLQSGGRDLRSAAQEVVGDREVFALQHDMVAVALVPNDGGQRVYAVLASGDGIRGPPPPPTGVYLVASAPEPRRSSLEQIFIGIFSRREQDRGRINIVLLSEKDALPYLRRLKAKPIKESDPIVQEVQAALAHGDLQRAHEIIQAEETPARARLAVALRELADSDLTRFKATINLLLENGVVPADLRQVRKAIDSRQIGLRRKDDRAAGAVLTEIQGQIAMKLFPLSPQDAANEMARMAGGRPGIVYVPDGFPEADFPPATHSLGEALPPDKAYITELFDQTMQLNQAPARLGSGHRSNVGSSLPPIDPPHVSSSPGPADLERLELMANHNSRLSWPLFVVVPCSTGDKSDEDSADEDDAKPSCYGSTEERLEDPEMAVHLQQAAQSLLRCDLDGDGSISDEQEKECVTTILVDQRKYMVTRLFP